MGTFYQYTDNYKLIKNEKSALLITVYRYFLKKSKLFIKFILIIYVKFKSTDNVQTDKNSKNGHTDNIILKQIEERRKVIRNP